MAFSIAANRGLHELRSPGGVFIERLGIALTVGSQARHGRR